MNTVDNNYLSRIREIIPKVRGFQSILGIKKDKGLLLRRVSSLMQYWSLRYHESKEISTRGLNWGEGESQRGN